MSRTYVSWAMTMAEHGPGGFYPRRATRLRRLPARLPVRPVAHRGCLPSALGGDDPWSLATALIKLPPMLVDIAVGYVLYRLVLGWAWPGRRAEALALAAAALYVFNPVTLYDSALWGQTDAVGALVILLGVAALIRGNSEGAALLGVARGARQAAVRAGAHPARGGPARPAPPAPARLGAAPLPVGPGVAAGLARPASRGWPRLLTSALVALAHVPSSSRCRSAWASPSTWS